MPGRDDFAAAGVHQAGRVDRLAQPRQLVRIFAPAKLVQLGLDVDQLGLQSRRQMRAERRELDAHTLAAAARPASAASSASRRSCR